MIKSSVDNVINSLKNDKSGFSARKLTALAFVFMTVYIHVRYVNSANCIEALMIDCGVILIALGIVTAQNLIQLKNGTPPKTDENGNN